MGKFYKLYPNGRSVEIDEDDVPPRNYELHKLGHFQVHASMPTQPPYSSYSEFCGPLWRNGHRTRNHTRLRLRCRLNQHVVANVDEEEDPSLEANADEEGIAEEPLTFHPPPFEF